MMTARALTTTQVPLRVWKRKGLSLGTQFPHENDYIVYFPRLIEIFPGSNLSQVTTELDKNLSIIWITGT